MVDDMKMVEEKARLMKAQSQAGAKKTPWFRIIVFLIFVGLLIYLFMNPEKIQEVTNKFFNDLLN